MHLCNSGVQVADGHLRKQSAKEGVFLTTVQTDVACKGQRSMSNADLVLGVSCAHVPCLSVRIAVCDRCVNMSS